MPKEEGDLDSHGAHESRLFILHSSYFILTMLFLLFQLGSDRYVLEASRIVEILPLLELRAIPQAPPGVAGIFNYRGQPVPAVDLTQFLLGQPARPHLSTRLVVVQYSDDGKQRLLGLIAEQATRIIRREPDDFIASGVKVDAAPYLGPVAMDPQGVIQWVREQQVLPEPVRELLFRQPAGQS
jgi:chemotaxis-related protein WspB